MEYIETTEALEALYGKPGDRPVRKELRMLDRHARAFIERAPFLAIGSQDGAGGADVTPRGDAPGFVRILDGRTLAIPDRPGNNRLDTWRNIVANPAVGLLFLIPGMNETLRVNGTARLTADAALCEQLAMNGKPARSVAIVKIEVIYMHCAKAFIRSGLWRPETWPDRSEMPTLGEILRDQLALEDSVEALDAGLDEAYRTRLW